MSQWDVLCGAWEKPNKGMEPIASSVRSCLALSKLSFHSGAHKLPVYLAGHV